MDAIWDETPSADDWMRGPGDAAETERMTVRYGMATSSPALSLETATALLDDLSENPAPDDASDERFNIAGLYLWIAASRGSRKAAFMIAEQIRWSVKNSMLRNADAVFFEQLAEKWDQLGETGVGAARSRLPPLAALKDKAPDPGTHPSFMANRPPPKGRAMTGSAGYMVVPRIGDDRSPEGIALSKRYAAVVGQSLPFRARMPEPGEVLRVLSEEWPWAVHVAKHIEGRLSVQRSVSVSRPSLKPILFFGPPGSGKTALAVRIAELFGIPSTVIAAGGTSDASGLSAITRGWSSSRPCGPVMAAAEHGCCDPAVIVDELDKTAEQGGKNGSVSGSFLGILGNPSSFHDGCLLAEVDLSKMLFMATANDLGSIPEALLDRFSVMFVGRPKEEHFDTVLGAMRRKAAAALGVRKELLPALDADEYGALRRHFVEGECSLREVERAYDFVLSEAVLRETGERTMSN